MNIKIFFLKLFFATPIWLLRLLTFNKRTIINGQILDYQTQIFLSLQPESLEIPGSAEEFRKSIAEDRQGLFLDAKPDSNIDTLDHNIQSDKSTLCIREYIPEIVIHKEPILYFHGGGYVIGSIATHDPWLRLLASKMQSRIYSLEYRLAPEYKFPAALEDANSALEWIAKKNDLPITSVSLCGDSAGGHLAASLSTFRSRGGLELPHSQCLIYPMTEPSCASVSQQEFHSGYFLTHKAMVWFWEQLLQSDHNLKNPCFDLLLEHSFQLPKTMIVTAGFDPLCEEGESYARKIFTSGNEVQQIHYPHLIHGFVNMTKLKSANAAATDLINTYRTYF